MLSHLKLFNFFEITSRNFAFELPNSGGRKQKSFVNAGAPGIIDDIGITTGEQEQRPTDNINLRIKSLS